MVIGRLIFGDDVPASVYVVLDLNVIDKIACIKKVADILRCTGEIDAMQKKHISHLY